MSNERFTQDEQTEIVRMAATLEIAIEDEKKELSKLYNQSYKNPPQKPVKKQINNQVQQVQPDYSALPKFNLSYKEYLAEQCKADHTFLNKIFGTNPMKVGVIMTIICIPTALFTLLSMFVGMGGVLVFLLSLVGSFGIIIAGKYDSKYTNKYNELRKATEFQIQSDPAYVEGRLAAERAAQEATQRAVEAKREEIMQNEAGYAKAVEDYNTRIIPQYEAAKQRWTQSHNLKIQMIQNDLAANERKLTDLYNQTKMISTHFRTIPQLVWIYEEMESSQHDFDMAIQLLNDDTTHNLLRGVIAHVDNMHNDMMQGMEAIFMQLDAINTNTAITNEMLDDMSERLRKTRRDMNIGNIVATYQRRKFRKEFEEFRRQFA